MIIPALFPYGNLKASYNSTGTRIQNNEYIGLSTDARPVSALVNGTYYEIDKGKFYVWDGSVWVEVLDLKLENNQQES